ncbi:amidohydrolase family protein [Nocardia sp. BMG111209]|uniref:amidohydrolase family protein n=1 Tax=Nocardia sp. BMG111209 TaxID=1160137 RepID=UPI000566B6EA|nr:amidohydrolase family protein [Nocardia sp. BMG111209]
MPQHVIISVDGHVKAPRAGYREYLDAEYRPEFDEWLRAAEARGLPDAGNIHPDLLVDAQWDADRRLRDLESQGVVGEVLFPNGIPFQAKAVSDTAEASTPELTRAGITAYNRWLADFCAQAPERLKGQALLSFDDRDRLDEAVAEVYRAKERGLGGIMMPALIPGGTYFFDPVLDPVWAAIQETGLPISQHGGTGAPAYDPPGLAAILTLAYEHSFFSGRSLWQMIVGGVFDRFPDLTVAYVETESWWIGAALDRFDRRFRRGDSWTGFAAHLRRERRFTRLPSEYWQTNCYAGISPFHHDQLPMDRMGSGYTPEDGEFVIGCDRAMVGIDYPHFETIYPNTDAQIAELTGQPTVTAADTRRLLFDNAVTVYGFDSAALQPVIDRVTRVTASDR